MEAAGLHLHRHVVERRQGAEVLGEAEQLERGGRHEIAFNTAAELATAPNTPPCISTIFNAAL